MSDKLAIREEAQTTTAEEEKARLKALGHEIKILLPGGNKLTDNQAIALARYSQLTKANPFRGEVYGYQGKGNQLALVDGYKLLIRWAKKISEYSDKYDPLSVGEEGTLDGDIAYRCSLLRHDLKSELQFYIQAGATFTEAYELVATQAVGVVRKKEQSYDPPQGWTWDQVARKRALKNALNLAYPMPSVEEIARDSWQVGDTETIDADWSESESYRTREEMERAAQLAARNRENQERIEQMTDGELQDKVKQNVALMRDNGDDDPLDLSPEPDDYDEDMPDDRSASGTWYPDLKEFKETCTFNFKRSWEELESLLEEKCGYGSDHIEFYDPAEAYEMYEALGSYLVSNS